MWLWPHGQNIPSKRNRHVEIVGNFDIFLKCAEKKVQYMNELQAMQKKNDERDYYNPFLSTHKKKVCTASIPNYSQWIVNLSLDGLTVPLKLDTGSDVNSLTISYYKMLKRKLEIKPTKIWLTSYTGDIIPITGKIYITINRKGTLHEPCFIITLRKVQLTLWKDACEKLKIIKRVYLI